VVKGLDRAEVEPDAQPVSELSVLLQDRQRDGLAYEEMARRARRNGHPKMSRQYITAVANGEIKRPTQKMLAGIAAGLSVPESTVKEAAARSAGIHVEHNVSYQTGKLLARVEAMAPIQRDRWFELASAIADVLAAEDLSKVYSVSTVVTTDDGSQLNEHTRRSVQASLDTAAANAAQRVDQRRATGN
jgi:transcriptional regulator with XRE-family HTH domain